MISLSNIFLCAHTITLSFYYSDKSNINPPFDGPDGILIPLRNNAAGKNTGLKLIMSNMSNEFFPTDNRRRGFNVSSWLVVYLRSNVKYTFSTLITLSLYLF